QPVDERLADLPVPRGVDISTVRVEDLIEPRLQRGRDRLQRGGARARVEPPDNARRLLGGGADVGHGTGLDGHGRRVPAQGRRPAQRFITVRTRILRAVLAAAMLTGAGPASAQAPPGCAPTPLAAVAP